MGEEAKEGETSAAAPEMVVEELPKANIRRVVKEKLEQLSTDSDINLLRDSLTAFSESARVFIHYIASAANEVCKNSNRQIMSAEDVLTAVKDAGFPELIRPLEHYLAEFQKKNQKKRSEKSRDQEPNKKAKLDKCSEEGTSRAGGENNREDDSD